jgi:ferric-dicitrate binding protein FerR (iron transport regulator)
MSRFEILLQAYINDSLNSEELAELNELIDSNESLLQISILKDLQQNSFAGLTDAEQRQKMYTNILKRTRKSNRVIPLWTKIAAAAIIVVVFSIVYFYSNHNPQKQIAKTETQQQRFKNDVAPGGNKAVLTLANGSQIILDSAANGTLTQQGNTKIIKLDSGQLSYNTSDVKSTEVLYNTISTPRGGQYQIVLSDGSKVWLNAASSLRFPAFFTGKERDVELTGEAYFEVTKNTAMPFTVTVNDLHVQVLGTHFNINAYNDETSVKTTLLKGSVRVADHESIVNLKPGQQAQLKDNALMVINNVDIEKVISWKTGFFEFDNTDLATIMRQISRWYNVDVRYEGKQSGETFGGRISRELNLSNILSMLETNGVKFRLEGKKLIVQP